MRVLYIAEIVGKAGIYCVKTVLPRLKKDREIDFVVANGDGATGGYGIGKNHSIYLRKLGIDVITGGDQTFYKKDIAEHIEKAYYMLRPANLPPEMPGRGWRHYSVVPREWVGIGSVPENTAKPESSPGDASPPGDTVLAGDAPASGTQPVVSEEQTTAPAFKIAVVSLLGQSGFHRIHGGNPFTYLKNILERITKESGAVIVDFHALTTAEKTTMFHYLDGNVTAVVGSGQRVQTADARVMSSGTAVICDAGRTGSINSVGGYLPEPEIKQYLTGIPIRSDDAWDALELQGVLIEIDPAGGYVTAFEAIRETCPPPPDSEQRGNGKKRGRS
ncbi:MAG: TIGR00282 family metallophosphoesterase [Alkalispirochaeta sp.]